MKQLFFVLIALLSLSLSISACGSDDASPEKTPGPESHETQGKTMDQLVEAYCDKHIQYCRAPQDQEGKPEDERKAACIDAEKRKNDELTSTKKCTSEELKKFFTCVADKVNECYDIDDCYHGELSDKCTSLK